MAKTTNPAAVKAAKAEAQVEPSVPAPAPEDERIPPPGAGGPPVTGRSDVEVPGSGADDPLARAARKDEPSEW